MVPDLGVDAVGEVDDGRPEREGEQVPLGREGEDLLGEQVLLHRAQELLRVRELLLPLEHLAEPGEALPVAALGAARLLVAPVGGHAVLGHAVHVAGADLDLHALAVGADQRGVQRLVAVRLGERDVILEAPRHRLPVGVHDAERLVALAHRVDHDAEGDQVVNLIVEQVLRLHLLVDRVEVLGAAGHLGLDLGLGELLQEGREDLLDVLLALGLALRDAALQLVVDLGMEEAQRVVLQVRLDPVDAEPVRERRVDVERLLRDVHLPLRRQVAEGPHVVSAVGELDQDDADVARHREQHLAEVLRLLLLARGEVDLADLGDPVDQARDLGAEVLLDLGERGERVLDRVVQQPGGDARHVEAEIRDDARHLERVGQVGLARGAPLALVHARRELVGTLDHLHGPARRVGADALHELADGHGARRACATISAASSSGVRPSV